MFLLMLVVAIMLLILMFHLELTQDVVLLILGAILWSLAHDSSHHWPFATTLNICHASSFKWALGAGCSLSMYQTWTMKELIQVRALLFASTSLFHGPVSRTFHMYLADSGGIIIPL